MFELATAPLDMDALDVLLPETRQTMKHVVKSGSKAYIHNMIQLLVG